jgi:hypothetical protein
MPRLRPGRYVGASAKAKTKDLVCWMWEHARASLGGRRREPSTSLRTSKLPHSTYNECKGARLKGEAAATNAVRDRAYWVNGGHVAKYVCSARHAVPLQRQRRQSGDWRSQEWQSHRQDAGSIKARRIADITPSICTEHGIPCPRRPSR